MNNLSHDLAQVDRPEGDLDWLAFQYVAGELSPAEVVGFEDRLACDRHACEALARMMQTVDALAVAVPACTLSSSAQTVLPARADRPARLGAAAGLVTAACLVAVAVFVSQSPQNVDTTSRAGEAGEIVSLWADTADDPDASDSERLDRAILGEDSDLSVPGWMISAVEFAAEEGEPEMEEN